MAKLKVKPTSGIVLKGGKWFIKCGSKMVPTEVVESEHYESIDGRDSIQDKEIDYV